MVNRHEEILESVTSLLADEEKLNRMKDNIKSLHLPNSSEVILQDIIKESEMIGKADMALSKKSTRTIRVLLFFPVKLCYWKNKDKNRELPLDARSHMVYS